MRATMGGKMGCRSTQNPTGGAAALAIEKPSAAPPVDFCYSLLYYVIWEQGFCYMSGVICYRRFCGGVQKHMFPGCREPCKTK